MKVKRVHIVAGLLAAADAYRDMADAAPHLTVLRRMERDMVRYAAYAETCDGFEFDDEEDNDAR